MLYLGFVIYLSPLTAGAHTDWGFLTVLATDGVPGLQIFLDGDWIDAPNREGMFVVNLGDMMHRSALCSN